MTAGLRVLLIVGAFLYVVFVIRKIRTSAIEFGDALFWILFSFCLLLVSIFPQIIDLLCDITGVSSPVNMVFLCIIALLSYKCFSMAVKLSVLSMKLKTLVSVMSAQSWAFQKAESEIESEKK